MIELRYVTPDSTTTEPPKLQYRTTVNVLEIGLHAHLWSEWTDVPLVVLPAND